jgi:uncharacterized protein YukE
MKHEIVSWQQNPVTQQFLNDLKTDRSDIKEDWAAGQFTVESIEGTNQLNSRALGAIQALESMIERIEHYADNLEDEDAD